jgi:hypothetical protein
VATLGTINICGVLSIGPGVEDDSSSYCDSLVIQLLSLTHTSVTFGGADVYLNLTLPPTRCVTLSRLCSLSEAYSSLSRGGNGRKAC